MELFDKLNIFHESESGAQTVVSARDHSFSRPGARMFETICESAVYRISSFPIYYPHQIALSNGVVPTST